MRTTHVLAFMTSQYCISAVFRAAHPQNGRIGTSGSSQLSFSVFSFLFTLSFDLYIDDYVTMRYIYNIRGVAA
jgi:hypothetical protein